MRAGVPTSLAVLREYMSWITALPPSCCLVAETPCSGLSAFYAVSSLGIVLVLVNVNNTPKCYVLAHIKIAQTVSVRMRQKQDRTNDKNKSNSIGAVF